MSTIKDYHMMFNENYDKAYKKNLQNAEIYFNTLNEPIFSLTKDGKIIKNTPEFKRWLSNVKKAHTNFAYSYRDFLYEEKKRKEKFIEHNELYHRDGKYERSLFLKWRRIVDNGSKGLSSFHFIIRDDIGIFDIETGEPILLFIKKYEKIKKVNQITNRIKSKEIEKPYHGLMRRKFLRAMGRTKFIEMIKKEKMKNLLSLGNL